MQDVWVQYGPPVYQSVAAYLGIPKKRAAGGKKNGAASDTVEKPKRGRDLLELLTMFPGGSINA